MKYMINFAYFIGSDNIDQAGFALPATLSLYWNEILPDTQTRL